MSGQTDTTGHICITRAPIMRMMTTTSIFLHCDINFRNINATRPAVTAKRFTTIACPSSCIC
ncbi:hypothetical protein COCSUDRAFT_32360 [Coccomyxa subellipsoidea C-169]|uniref:Uncharacterized protein n=1 Tax=Coccomyxa subellipsoidea (strain C-169) TaxID=574566 RepID=I0Z510_COCSC|nr:hypothetical protein COCSUDRAFT_32360 [Coccomyxa subellipsoidea C-169]EIE25729.1 hypothetical protein COCSUDRAFT_32360 [Coccomyxa subellipsoidea C-169]|eukprot:XP_005650273.1 hypothetical protein COCSUDRAFT_32360 [Coccomyxa subellipsoidea C-169]